MHVTVNILPPATGPVNRHVQLPSKGIISLTVLAKPEQTFLSVWSEIERIYVRNYVPPGQRSNFQIKKLQNIHGADIDLEFTVGDFFEGETAAKIIQVVQAPIDRETSVLVTSNLRPHLYDYNKRKRVLEEQEETRKRRKQEEEQYGQALENLDPDRPLRSSESYIPDGNTFTIPESPNPSGQKARQFLDDHREAIVVQDSQPDGQMEVEMDGHVNGQSYSQDIIHDETVQFSSGHAAKDNSSPSMSPELGDQDFERTAAAPAPVFKKPALPASGRRVVKPSARPSPLSAAITERAPSFPRNPYAPATYDVSDQHPPVAIPQSNIPQPRAEHTDVYDEIETVDAQPRERDVNQLQSASALKQRGKLPAENLKAEGSRQQNAKRLKLGPSAGPSSRNRHPLLQQHTSVSTPRVVGALNGHHTADLADLEVATHADATTGPQATPPLAPLGELSRNPRYRSPMTSAEKLQRLRERRVSSEDDRHPNVPQERRGNFGNSLPVGNRLVAQPRKTENLATKPDISAHHDHQGFVETDGQKSDDVDDEAYEEASRQVEEYLHEQIEAQSEDDLPEQTTATTSFSRKSVGPKRTVAPNPPRATAVTDQLKSAAKGPRKWTPEEDQILLAARTRGDPWPAVVSRLPGRNRDSCSKRYARLTGSKRQAAPATELQQPDLQQWLGSDAADHAGEGSSQNSRGSTANRRHLNGPVDDKAPGVNATKQQEAKKQKAVPPAIKSQDNIRVKAAEAKARHEQTGVARSTPLAAQNPNRTKSKDEVRSLGTDGAPRDKRLTGDDVRDLLAILEERKAHRKSSSQSICEDARGANELSASKHTPQHAVPASHKVASRPLRRDDIVRSPEDERMSNATGHSSGGVIIANQQQDVNVLDYVDDYAVDDAPDDAAVEDSNLGPPTARGPYLKNGLEIEESEAGYAEGRTTAAGTFADEPPTGTQFDGGHGVDGTQSDEYELPALFDKELRYFASQSTAAERGILPSPAASVSDRSPARYVSASPDAQRQSSSEDEGNSSGRGRAENGEERRSLSAKPDTVALREDGQEDRNRKKAAEPPTEQSVNRASSARLVNGDGHGSKSGPNEPAEPRPRNAARDGNTIATAGRQALIDDEAEEASESSSEEESEDEESEEEGASSEEEEQREETTAAPFAPHPSHRPNPSPTVPASKAAGGVPTIQPPLPSQRRSPPKAPFTASDSQQPQFQAAKDPSPPSPRRSPRMAMRSSTASGSLASIPASTPATSQATVHTQPRTTNQRAVPPMKATLSSRNGQSVSDDRPTTPPPAQSTSDAQQRRSPRLNGAMPSQDVDQLQSRPASRPIPAASKFPSRLSELKSRHSTPLTGGLTASTRVGLSSSRQLHTITGLSKTHSVASRTTITTATAGKSQSDSESSSSGSSSEDDDEEEETAVEGKIAGVNGVSRTHASKTSEAEKGQRNRYQGLMKSMYNLIGSPFTSSGTH